MNNNPYNSNDEKISNLSDLSKSNGLKFSRHKNYVQFTKTTVYYFERQQGSCSVPEKGGCTLGMAKTHFDTASYSAVHFKRIRRMEKKQMNLASINESLSIGSNAYKKKKRRFGKSTRVNCRPSLNPGDSRRVPLFFSPPQLSPQSNEKFPMMFQFNTPPPPCLSPPNNNFITPMKMSPALVDTSSILDTDSEASMDASTLKTSKTLNGVKRKKSIMPLPPVTRNRLLKQSGVSSIDETERWECAKLRSSRTQIGCCCGFSTCQPETCVCALNGISCQVDRPGFPCSCDSKLCKNPSGRVDFSSSRVKVHANHVLERLKTSPLSPTNRSSLSTVHGECAYCTNLNTFLSPNSFSVDKKDESLIPYTSTLESVSIVNNMQDNNTVDWKKLTTDPAKVNNFEKIELAQTVPTTSSPSIPTIRLSNSAQSFSSTNDYPSQKPLIGPIKQPSTSHLLPNGLRNIAAGVVDLPYGRLSLRKRRIIRSPIPQPTRKKPSKNNLLAVNKLSTVNEDVVNLTPSYPENQQVLKSSSPVPLPNIPGFYDSPSSPILCQNETATVCHQLENSLHTLYQTP